MGEENSGAQNFWSVAIISKDEAKRREINNGKVISAVVVSRLKQATPYLLALLFTAVIFQVMVNKHNAFNTRTYDFARFDQAIWNVLNGRFLYTTIDHRSILGNHFSPYMALLAPLFLLWPDERMLFLAQAASLAVAGLILYVMVRRRSATLAPWFLLAFYLNPALHDVAVFEFRRIALAVPFLALALYAIDLRKRWLMLFALIIALLCKEDVGLFVFGVGLFLLIFQRDWRWGGAMMLLGAVWAVGVSLWVIPAFREPGTEYPQLFYFDYLGNSYGEILATLRRDPLLLPRQILSVERLMGLLRVFLPLGLFLPFLGADWLLIAGALLALLWLSGDSEMYQLEKWYTAPLLPIFFAAVAVGLDRLSPQWKRWGTVWLVAASVLGFIWVSPLPGGGRYEPSLYNVDEHAQLGLQMVAAVPSTASVATQPHYTPHLAHRQSIYHYPWIKIGVENIDYFLFDRHSSPYPLSQEELDGEINNMLADPTLAPVAEADGIYIFARDESLLGPQFPLTAVAEQSMQLQGFDVALQDEDGIYRLLSAGPIVLQPGQNLRVDLYWQALAAPEGERTVSVRLADETGFLHGQHDGVPGLGSKPTSWWEPGWQIRDVHYLTVAPQSSSGPLLLELVLYDTFTQENIPFADDQQRALLAPVEID